MASYEDLMAAARKADADGASDDARRLLEMAVAARDQRQSAPEASAEQPERTIRHRLYDNIIGDPDDGVDSWGEQAGRVLNDAGSAFFAGIGRGAAGLAGMPGTIGDAIDSSVTRAGKAAGILPDDAVAPRSRFSSNALIDDLSELTGGASDFRGDTTAGRYAGTVGEFLPGAAIAGMNPANLLRYGVAPGVASEAAGQMTEGTAAEPWARTAAALAAPVAIAGADKLVRKVVSPYGGADPERLRMAQQLENEGISLTAGQKVGNEQLRRREGFTPQADSLMRQQSEDFTSRVLATAGTDAQRATPDVLQATARRIGKDFEDATAGLTIQPSQSDIEAISGAADVYRALAPTGNRAPLIENVAEAMTVGDVPAGAAASWRSQLSKLTTSPDAATREAAIQAIDALDNSISGALSAAGRADDVAKLSQAREQWRNFIAIQKAASGAGEQTAAGILSPSAVRNAVASQGRSAYAQGRRGDLGALSRAAEGVMKRLPTSGTAENIRALTRQSGLSGTIGAGAGAAIGGGPMGAVVGAALGSSLPAARNALLMSQPVQNYLANQFANPSALRAFDPRIISAIPGVVTGER